MIIIIPPDTTYDEGFSFPGYDRDGLTAEFLGSIPAENCKYFFKDEPKTAKCSGCFATAVEVRTLIYQIKEPVNRTFVADLCDHCRLLEGICGVCLRLCNKASLRVWNGRFACVSCLTKLGELDHDH